MSPELHVVSLTNDVAIATFRQVLLVHFRRETPQSSATPIQNALDSIVQRHKAAVFFAVIETESVPPDNEARKAFTRLFEQNNDRLACAVVTYRGEGFRGAAVRTIVSGIMILPRRFKFPRHITGSVDEAASLALRHVPGLDTAALLRAFDELSRMSPTS
jgi:hypothetical protein